MTIHNHIEAQDVYGNIMFLTGMEIQKLAIELSKVLQYNGQTLEQLLTSHKDYMDYLKDEQDVDILELKDGSSD